MSNDRDHDDDTSRQTNRPSLFETLISGFFGLRNTSYSQQSRQSIQRKSHPESGTWHQPQTQPNLSASRIGHGEHVAAKQGYETWDWSDGFGHDAHDRHTQPNRATSVASAANDTSDTDWSSLMRNEIEQSISTIRKFDGLMKQFSMFHDHNEFGQQDSRPAQKPAHDDDFGPRALSERDCDDGILVVTSAPAQRHEEEDQILDHLLSIFQKKQAPPTDEAVKNDLINRCPRQQEKPQIQQHQAEDVDTDRPWRRLCQEYFQEAYTSSSNHSSIKFSSQQHNGAERTASSRYTHSYTDTDGSTVVRSVFKRVNPDGTEETSESEERLPARRALSAHRAGNDTKPQVQEAEPSKSRSFGGWFWSSR